MRRVTGDATFDLHGLMLEDKGTGFVRMAFETGRILRCSCSQLPRLESAVRIVAVAAFHQALVNPVMKRPRKLLFRFDMAGVAQLRLLGFHQELIFRGLMRRVAIDAAHIIPQRAPNAQNCCALPHTGGSPGSAH